MTNKDDERFDTWLREASADYNAPAPNLQVPREDMWRAISAARVERRAPRSRFVVAGPWTLAAAAALLLAVGIGIGRMTDSEQVSPPLAALPANDSASAVYDVAATRHLTSAEAFVTAVRMSSYAGSDSTIRRWARDLLTDTRLLLDSPAGTDVRRRRLLEDLELLIVQIMQLENSRTSDNELLLDRTQQDQLLTRLRANVPAGPPARS